MPYPLPVDPRFSGGTADPRRLMSIGRQMPPWLRGLIKQTLAEADAEHARLTEALDGYQETKDRLRILQHVLICLIKQQGGHVDLSAGEINHACPPGSVVTVTKLSPGEGDYVPLRIGWRPPGEGTPATTDYRPEGL